MNTGNVRLAWLHGGELERAGIRTYLALADDDLFGGDLYRVLVDEHDEARARAIVEGLPTHLSEDEEGILSFATDGAGGP